MMCGADAEPLAGGQIGRILDQRQGLYRRWRVGPPWSALSNPTCRLQGRNPTPHPTTAPAICWGDKGRVGGLGGTQCHRNRKLGPGPAGRPAEPSCQIEFVVRAVEEARLGISIRHPETNRQSDRRRQIMGREMTEKKTPTT